MPATVAKLTRELQAAAAEAARLTTQLDVVRARRDSLILALVDAGWSHRQIAAIAGVAYPRVAQLVAKRLSGG